MPNRNTRNQIRQSNTGIESQRPLFAWKCIEEVLETEKDNYKSYVQKLPALIQSNGMGQTLGFLYSKSSGDTPMSKAYNTLLTHIREYSCFRGVITEQNDTYKNDQFIRHVVNFDTETYFQAEEEILLLIRWLKRFSEGKFGGRI